MAPWCGWFHCPHQERNPSLCRFSVTHAVNTAPAHQNLHLTLSGFNTVTAKKYCTCQANQTRRGDSKVSAKQRAFCKTGKIICILCCNSGSRPCELGRQASKQASRQPRGCRNCNKTKNVRMRENFRGASTAEIGANAHECLYF